jgi:MSHA biogenesis protein MshN
MSLPNEVPASVPSRQWFWSILALLMVLAIAWVAWVAYQIHLRPLATELAYKAAEERQVPAPVVQVAATPAPEPVAQASAPEAQPAQTAQATLFKMAPSIQTPLDAQVKAQGAGEAGLMATTEAQEQFSIALGRYAAHHAERQALVSLLIDRGRLDEARRVLDEGLSVNSGNLLFATSLARVFIERRDYVSAANALVPARTAGENDAGYQLLLAMVWQQQGKHADAIGAFEKAGGLRAHPDSTWLAMGRSLEATGRKAEASQAYQRSLAGGTLSPDARTYAEGRVRSLR